MQVKYLIFPYKMVGFQNLILYLIDSLKIDQCVVVSVSLLNSLILTHVMCCSFLWLLSVNYPLVIRS